MKHICFCIDLLVAPFWMALENCYSRYMVYIFHKHGHVFLHLISLPDFLYYSFWPMRIYSMKWKSSRTNQRGVWYFWSDSGRDRSFFGLLWSIYECPSLCKTHWPWQNLKNEQCTFSMYSDGNTVTIALWQYLELVKIHIVDVFVINPHVPLSLLLVSRSIFVKRCFAQTAKVKMKGDTCLVSWSFSGTKMFCAGWKCLNGLFWGQVCVRGLFVLQQISFFSSCF